MASDLQVLIVGRASKNGIADIQISSSEDTVGRQHAELTYGTDGRCYIVDRGSSNGTFVQKEGQWKRVRQTALSIDTPLRLGDFTTTPRELQNYQPHR